MEINLKKSYVGIKDQPIDPVNGDIDLLSLTPYIDGLSEFIQNCTTPMTIAIQGDWGTGKTSMMNMIKYALEASDKDKSISTLWFNTWQYSQFNLSDNLPISLLTYLAEKTSKEKGERANNLVKTAKKLGFFAIKTSLSVAGVETGSLDELLNKETNFAAEIENLKADYEKAVNELLSRNNKDRLVVFIDDLDRLNPEIAVEVLEVLKVFLDVENCVYVLAVDYEVVTQGIRKKYGENVAILKGKSFFDKIIQLPFKMPVSLFDLSQFLKSQLSIYNITNPKTISCFEQLTKGSIGSNPRTMKRLFNSFQLIKSIFQHDENKDQLEEYENKLLFAVLCIQLAFEPLYEYFVGTNDWLNADDPKNIFLLNQKEIQDKLSTYDESISSKYANKIFAFLRILRNTITTELTGEKLVDLDLENFEKVLNYSFVTTTTIGSTGDASVAISIKENLSNYSINGISYKDKKENVTGFTKAFVWILEQIGKESSYKLKFHEIVKKRDIYNKIPNRFFDAENIEPKLKSSVKYIQSLDVKVITNYSSKDLKSILIKILDILEISQDDITIYGVKKIDEKP